MIIYSFDGHSWSLPNLRLTYSNVQFLCQFFWIKPTFSKKMSRAKLNFETLNELKSQTTLSEKKRCHGQPLHIYTVLYICFVFYSILMTNSAKKQILISFLWSCFSCNSNPVHHSEANFWYGILSLRTGLMANCQIVRNDEITRFPFVPVLIYSTYSI